MRVSQIVLLCVTACSACSDSQPRMDDAVPVPDGAERDAEADAGVAPDADTGPAPDQPVPRPDLGPPPAKLCVPSACAPPSPTSCAGGPCPMGQHCEPTEKVCVACHLDEHCAPGAGSTGICKDNVCEGCLVSNDCVVFNLGAACDKGRCVECLVDSDCGPFSKGSTGQCDPTTRTCERCEEDKQCQSAGQGVVCLIGQASKHGRCGACRETADCPAGRFCHDFRCLTGCEETAQCPEAARDRLLGKRACYSCEEWTP